MRRFKFRIFRAAAASLFLWFWASVSFGQNVVEIPVLDPQDVRGLQAALRFLGYSLNDLDGAYGEETRRAVEAFEFSIGMGNEGELDEGEQALLEAQVIALSFEKFGYGLAGLWGLADCVADPETGIVRGLWLDDLALKHNGQAYVLVEQVPDPPWFVDLAGQPLSLSSPYLEPHGATERDLAGLALFPQPDRLLVVRAGQAVALSLCRAETAKGLAEQNIDLPFVELSD